MIDQKRNPEYRASQLSSTARQRAVNFIFATGNDLQVARYNLHLAEGHPDQVTKALKHFQNKDGGFGHGLEADLRTENSSVVATTVAL